RRGFRTGLVDIANWDAAARRCLSPGHERAKVHRRACPAYTVLLACGAKASASSDSTSAASAVDEAHGVPTTRRSSRNALACYGSSRKCSAATNRSQWIGSMLRGWVNYFAVGHSPARAASSKTG